MSTAVPQVTAREVDGSDPPPPPRTRRRPLLAEGGTVAAIASGGALLLFWRLGRGSLLDWDEATYAEIAREIHVFHSWVFLHWNWAPWLNKAPLYPWLTGLVFTGGADAFRARAVSAAAGVATLLVTYLIGRRVYGRGVGVVAAVVLASGYEFVTASRFGTSDGLLTLFLYLSIYTFIRALDGDRRWWYATGAAVGLALMTKDFAALVAPLAFAVALAVDGRLAVLRRREVWAGAAVALVVALPWHLAQLVHSGRAFLQDYVGNMVVQRTAGEIEGHTGNATTYVALARNQFFPWFYAVPFAGLFFLAERRRERSRSSILLVFPLVVFLVFTLARSKLAWYILPIYPALAVLVAALLVRALRSPLRLACLAVAALAAIVSVPASVARTPRTWVAVFLVVLVVGVLLARLARRPPAWAVVASVTAFLCALAGHHLQDLYQLPDQPVVRLAPAAAAGAGSRPIVLYLTGSDQDAPYNVSHSLIFYSRHQVDLVEGSDGRHDALGCQVPTAVVTPAQNVAALAAVYRVRTLATSAPFTLLQVVPGPRSPGCGTGGG